MRRCQNPRCNKFLPAYDGPGRKPIWCSEKCRKTKYGGTCEKCGGPTSGTSSGKHREVKLCKSCSVLPKDAELNREVLNLWNLGWPEKRIARYLGVSCNQVRGRIGYARQKGLDVRLHRLRNRDAWDTIKRMWNAGLPASLIATAVGSTNAASIYATLETMRAKGIDVPPRAGHADEAKRREYVRLWNEGKSMAEIARIMGVSYGGVGSMIHVLREQGYNVPYRRKPKASA